MPFGAGYGYAQGGLTGAAMRTPRRKTEAIRPVCSGVVGPAFLHNPPRTNSIISTIMNAEPIQEIWTEIQSSMEAFQAAGTEFTRIDALEKATKLARALEKPRDAILKLAYTVSLRKQNWLILAAHAD